MIHAVPNTPADPDAQADLAIPSRFGNLDPGYLVATDKEGDNEDYYFGDYSQQVFDYDYEHRGTISISEFASSPLVQVPAALYTGNVFLLIGQYDQVSLSAIHE